MSFDDIFLVSMYRPNMFSLIPGLKGCFCKGNHKGTWKHTVLACFCEVKKLYVLTFGHGQILTRQGNLGIWKDDADGGVMYMVLSLGGNPFTYLSMWNPLVWSLELFWWSYSLKTYRRSLITSILLMIAADCTLIWTHRSFGNVEITLSRVLSYGFLAFPSSAKLGEAWIKSYSRKTCLVRTQYVLFVTFVDLDA